MIKYVSFDLGGVVLKPGTMDDFLLYFKDNHDLDADHVMDAFLVNWQDWDDGVISAEDFWNTFTGEIGVNMKPRELSDMIFAKDSLDMDTLDLVDRLKKNYTVGALSNIPREWLDYAENNHGISQYFDHLIASCNVGKGKPNIEIYRAVEKECGFAPSEIVHIDDMYKFYEGALKAGWNCILYSNHKQLEHELSDLGVEF